MPCCAVLQCAGESSYAHHVDLELGVHVADQFTHHLATFLHRLRGPASPETLAQAMGFAASQVGGANGVDGGRQAGWG